MRLCYQSEANALPERLQGSGILYLDVPSSLFAHLLIWTRHPRAFACPLHAPGTSCWHHADEHAELGLAAHDDNYSASDPSSSAALR